MDEFSELREETGNEFFLKFFIEIKNGRKYIFLIKLMLLLL
ncbi:hypothetical protein C095_11515 [Fusobacterium necrophorum subsp. funduliforme B35]|uniref:Uncharacterized protein n=1 Tax=Fusobacterium necrophorum subsp. funduliforme B35 TaxID=1226633 RepID=A0A0B4E3U6_9FUSO|nr:hypothetical protein C095_11515 [Fusobacterium necrophorum subsp. funduliforme B35]